MDNRYCSLKSFLAQIDSKQIAIYLSDYFFKIILFDHSISANDMFDLYYSYQMASHLTRFFQLP